MKGKYTYFKIYKPFGMLSQFSKSNPGEVTLADLNYNFPKDVYPVGRLDKDSEGLLILTNDNQYKHKMTDPKFDSEKTYWVQVDGEVSADALNRFAKGDIDIKLKSGIYRCKPAKARILDSSETQVIPDRDPPIRFRKNIPTTWLEIKITEGKNRQIRKMTAQVGNPTLRLIRVGSEETKLENWEIGNVTEFN